MYRTVIECEDGFYRSTAENEAMPTLPDPDAKPYETAAEAVLSHNYGDPVAILTNYLTDHRFPSIQDVLQVPRHHWREPANTKLTVLYKRWYAPDCGRAEQQELMLMLVEMYNTLSCDVSSSSQDWSLEYGQRARTATEWARLYKLIAERAALEEQEQA